MNTTNRTQSNKKSQWFMLIAIALIALLAGIAFNSWRSKGEAPVNDAKAAQAQLNTIQEKLIATTVLPDTFKQVPAFSLLGPNGETVTEALFENKWTMVFFGFTHCPDVCPTTLYVMSQVAEALKEKTLPELQVVFVTVDPARDTIEKVTDYVAFFSDEFIGISGSLNDITQLTGSLGIVASFTASTTDPADYTVDHTASMLLVSPKKNVRAKFGPPHEVDSIISDYNTIVSAIN